MQSQRITQSEQSISEQSIYLTYSNELEDKQWDELLYKAIKDADEEYEDGEVIHRRSTKGYRILTAIATVSYEAGQSFVYSAAFLPTNDYDQGIGIVSGYLVPPLCEAVNQLVNKNQDVRVILRAQHALFDGSAVVGFTKMFAKHILSPVIPVVIAVYGTGDPVKDFEHSFIHASLHATLGYTLYKLCTILVEKKWPFKEVERKALSTKAQFVQDYIAAPMLAGFPRMVLVAEFLRKTGLGVFKWLDDQNLHAPLVFGSSYFIYHFWRMHTQEFRKVPPYVTSDKEVGDVSFVDKQVSSSDKMVDTQVQSVPEGNDEEVLTKSCSQKLGDFTLNSLKAIPIFIGGACGNYLYSRIVGTTHDDLLLERTQRDAFVAMGMYAAWVTLKVGEQATKKVLQGYGCFFHRSKESKNEGPIQEKTHFIQRSTV